MRASWHRSFTPKPSPTSQVQFYRSVYAWIIPPLLVLLAHGRRHLHGDANTQRPNGNCSIYQNFDFDEKPPNSPDSTAGFNARLNIIWWRPLTSSEAPCQRV